MAEIEYLDFDLRIDRSPAGYRTRVLHAPAGEASDEFALPFSDLEIENFLLRVGRPGRSTRRMESQEMAAAKIFGGKLFRAAFSGNVLSCFSSSLEQAVQQNKGLRLRLRLTDAPELSDLPWEYLYNPDFNRFFSLSVETPIVRYIELPNQIKPLAIRPPLRLLVMIASPQDYPTLDVEGEWRKLQDALAGLIRRQAVQLDRLTPATLPALREKLRTDDYHVFHFIGHGAFDESVQDGLLLMEDASGKGKAVAGQSLGTVLHDERTLRLAVLNACEGARAARTDPFAGVAQSLLQQEIPAVIAMQFPITDEAAATFSREFYSAIAAGLPMDAATAEARKAILTDVNDVEWGTPVLYLRAADGRVFDIAGKLAPPVTRPADQRTSQRLAELYDQALGCYYTDQWGQAIQLLNEILTLQPGYEDAANKLADAIRQQTLLDNYTAGQGAYQSGAWAEAIQWLEATVAVAPGYRDAAALLAEARRQRELADLYAEARRVFKTGNWRAVINVGERIATLAPDYPDPDGLLATAQAQLVAEEQERRAAAAYSQGLRHLDARQWTEAVTAFEQAEAAVPGYQQTPALLARARNNLAEQRTAEESEPNYRDVTRKLAEARQQQALAEQFDRAVAHMRAERWGEAVQALREIVAQAPNYADPAHGSAARILSQALQQKERAELPSPPVRRSRPAPPEEEPRPRGKPKDIPR